MAHPAAVQIDGMGRTNKKSNDLIGGLGTADGENGLIDCDHDCSIDLLWR